MNNEYYWELVRKGPDVRWTDAIYPLVRDLNTLLPPNIYFVDRGIFEPVDLLSENAPVHELDFGDTANLRKIVADPRGAFVTHTAKYAFLPAGYEEVPVEIVYDHYGRATFEVFRFRKIPL